MTDDERTQIASDFNDSVNMTPKQIEDWWKTDESKEVGQKDGDSESVGHHSGRRIIEIKNTKKADLTDADYEHMQKVNSYVKRHSAQGPKSDVEHSKWRYSLMNWGNDPLKK